jgi:hypothetical protein
MSRDEHSKSAGGAPELEGVEAGAVFHDGVGRHHGDCRCQHDLVRQGKSLVVEDPQGLLAVRMARRSQGVSFHEKQRRLGLISNGKATEGKQRGLVGRECGTDTMCVSNDTERKVTIDSQRKVTGNKDAL